MGVFVSYGELDRRDRPRRRDLRPPLPGGLAPGGCRHGRGRPREPRADERRLPGRRPRAAGALGLLGRRALPVRGASRAAELAPCARGLLRRARPAAASHRAPTAASPPRRARRSRRWPRSATTRAERRRSWSRAPASTTRWLNESRRPLRRRRDRARRDDRRADASCRPHGFDILDDDARSREIIRRTLDFLRARLEP